MLLFLNRIQQEKAPEPRRLPDQLPDEDQLHVRPDEEDSDAGDLRSDFVSLAEGGRGGLRTGNTFLLLCSGSGQRVSAHRVGEQPHGAADRRQGEKRYRSQSDGTLTQMIFIYNLSVASKLL